MKKVISIVTLILLVMALTACGKSAAPAEAPQSSEPIGMPNPWRECTREEAAAFCPNLIAVPEGAENVRWSVMESAAGESGVPGALVQLSFDLNGLSFTAREQVTGDEETDISGMYYEWTYQADETLENWDGRACHSFRWIGESEYADLCTWYDTEIGISYSLGVRAADLDGFDLLAIVEALRG